LSSCSPATGDQDRAVAVLNEALTTADGLGYRTFEAELHRARGDILLQRDPANSAPAEEAFLRAIAIAKRQGAQLRAARGDAFRSAQRSATGLSRPLRRSRPVRRRETWRQSGEFLQALAGMAEGQAGLEPLHQSEYVARGIAGWIPPAASSMANDHSGSRPNFFASQAKAARHRREQETGGRKTTSSGGVCAVPPTERRRSMRSAANCRRPAQAVLRSRVRAFIWAMRTGPSENSPALAFRVSSRK
jgi:hypothetical protein